MESIEFTGLNDSLRKYWAILYQKWWLWVITTLICTIGAILLSLNMTPVYKATTQLLIQQASNPADIATYSDILLSERLARTYAKLLTTRPVLEQTLQRLGLTNQISIGELKRRISVQPVRDTTLIQLSVEDTDPERAIALANTLPEVFTQYNEKVQLSRFEESRKSLEEQLKRLEEELNRIQSQLASAKENPNATPAEITRLETQITTLQASYANLLKQYEEVRLAEAQSMDNIIITEHATTASRVRPRTLFNTLLGAIIGLLLGLGIVVLQEYIDDTVKTPDEIERAYKLPVLSSIADVPELNGDHKTDKTEEQTPSLIVHVRSREPVSEAFRALRTNLQFVSIDNPLRSLVITSSEPSEGKSFVAGNLAIAIAQAERKVILVDADLRKPKIHKMFGLPKTPGLTNLLLAKEENIEAYLQETEISNLQIITAGTEAPNPAELLASQQMSRLISLLLERAEFVIFDTPPVLVATDAPVLSQKCDGTLLVVRVAQTHHPALLRAIQELSRVQAHIVGIALNGLPTRKGGYYNYRYYPYQYGYYTEDGTQKPKGKLAWLKRWKIRG